MLILELNFGIKIGAKGNLGEVDIGKIIDLNPDQIIYMNLFDRYENRVMSKVLNIVVPERTIILSGLSADEMIELRAEIRKAIRTGKDYLTRNSQGNYESGKIG